MNALHVLPTSIRVFVDRLNAPLVGGKSAAKTTTDRGYLVNPIFDLSLLILSPLWALVFGYMISLDEVANQSIVTGPLVEHFSYSGTPVDLLMGTIIMAHVFVVFFRSHGNPAIFRQFKARFTLVPVLLFVGLMTSSWVVVCTTVLATWWDVYHSGAQTFGLARIYDSRVGNDSSAGRRWDFWLNQVLYAGPILAGAMLMSHVDDFEEFGDVQATFFTAIPAKAATYHSWITWAVIGIGVPFIACYLLAFRKLRKQGYMVSTQKALLLASTALVSIWAWGFNSFGQAFVIMNLFHAVQYFAIVWATEKESMQRLFRLGRSPGIGRFVTLGLFLAIGTVYGVTVEVGRGHALFAASLVISIMHFWYDGFIWSVRRKQVDPV